MHAEEQACLIGDAWERLPDPKLRFNLEIHMPNGDKMYKVLGPHAPNLTANEVENLHRLWLQCIEELGPNDKFSHADVVSISLIDLERELNGPNRDAILSRLRSYAEKTQRTN